MCHLPVRVLEERVAGDIFCILANTWLLMEKLIGNKNLLEHIHGPYRGLTCCLAYAMYFRRNSTGKGLKSLSFTGSNLSLLRREEFPSKTCCKPPLACCRTAANKFHKAL